LRARASAVVLLAALGSAAAIAVTTARADDPAPPATVTVVQTRTVQARYQGWTAKTWAKKNAQNKRNSLKRGRTIARLKHANRMRLALGADGLTRAFLCIHHFEGSWKAHTGNGYFGGVQADRDFMQTYGGAFYRAWGTADHWPPFIQIAVAESAYLSGRGFAPWPNTSRACGLR
jgi:hypothetical protein